MLEFASKLPMTLHIRVDRLELEVAMRSHYIFLCGGDVLKDKSALLRLFYRVNGPFPVFDSR
jgi:hypothetical protein